MTCQTEFWKELQPNSDWLVDPLDFCHEKFEILEKLEKLDSNYIPMPQNLTVPDLFQALPENDRVHAFQWWAKISSAEREELSEHWEESLQKDA
jgi:hypothetical protein